MRMARLPVMEVGTYHLKRMMMGLGPCLVKKTSGHSTGGFRSSREEESRQKRRLQLQMMINLLLEVKCRLSPCGRPEQMNDDRMDAPRRSRRLLNKGGITSYTGIAAIVVSLLLFFCVLGPVQALKIHVKL